MKILPVSTPVSPPTVSKVRASSVSASSATGKSDSVSIGSFASRLSALESTAKSAPVIDTEKVAAIRDAIASGQFSVNVDAIADAVISSARELVSSRNS